MLFYLEAKVIIRVAGISGPFEQTNTWLVNGENLTIAKEKFEKRVREENAHVQAQSIVFQYLKTAGEIK